MILIARVGQIEMFLDDEQPGTISYTPEHIEDLSKRLGRVAVGMYEDIPAPVVHITDDEGGEV